MPSAIMALSNDDRCDRSGAVLDKSGADSWSDGEPRLSEDVRALDVTGDELPSNLFTPTLLALPEGDEEELRLAFKPFSFGAAPEQGWCLGKIAPEEG